MTRKRANKRQQAIDNYPLQIIFLEQTRTPMLEVVPEGKINKNVSPLELRKHEVSKHLSKGYQIFKSRAICNPHSVAAVGEMNNSCYSGRNEYQKKESNREGGESAKCDKYQVQESGQSFQLFAYTRSSIVLDTRKKL